MSKKHRKHTQPENSSKSAEANDAIASNATGQDKWPALTGLRGLAAFGVLCMHAFQMAGKPASIPQPLAWLFAMGWSGVDVFFTLSAFLLTIPFVLAEFDGATAPTLSQYAWRRVIRILPAYYVQIAILLALGALGVASSWAWNSPKFSEVALHLAFCFDAWPLLPTHLSPWWTLPVEMSFYLLLPLFARCLRPRRWPWLLLAIVGSVAYRFALMHAGLSRPQEVYWVEHLPGRLHEFLIGMLAAYAFVRLKIRLALPRPKMADALAAAATLGFLLLPALGYLVTDHPFAGGPVRQPLLLCWYLFASAIIAVLLVALVAGAPTMTRVFSWAPLRGLGLISYSLYLWHYPLMLGLREELGGFSAIGADFWPFYFYGVLISLTVAFVSWWMIERPAQQWGRRVKLAA